MPKVKPSPIVITGKRGDDVFIDSVKYGQYSRKAPEAGSKKHESALQQQYNRTAFLNTLASELNTIIKVYTGQFKSSRFYEQVQSRFRKEPLDNRLLLLQQLKGLEINPRYPMKKSSHQHVEVRAVKNKIVVDLRILLHPEPGKHRANCYYYELVLLYWDKSKKMANHTNQFSEWVPIKKGMPEFEFQFDKPPGTRHWLLCLRQRLGVNERLIEAFATDGMQIVAAGTFDKKEAALLKEREDARKERLGKAGGKKEVEAVVRVKAKRVV